MKINLGIVKKLSNFIFENMDAMFFYFFFESWWFWVVLAGVFFICEMSWMEIPTVFSHVAPFIRKSLPVVWICAKYSVIQRAFA